MTFLLVIENCIKITTQQQWYRRRPQIVGGGAPHSSNTKAHGNLRKSMYMHVANWTGYYSSKRVNSD